MKSKSSGLLTLFWVSSLVSLTVILALTYVGIRNVFHHNILDIAERQSVGVGRALYVQERELLTGGDADGASTLEIADTDFDQLDVRMRDYLAPFGITKIKAFNDDGTIVYSTDPAIIGEDNSDNSKLQRALRGSVVSGMETKDKVMDLAEETRFDVDVVETYLPVRNDDDRIIGSFEVYLDMTPYREQMSSAVRTSALSLAAILLATFGVQFLIMRKGTNRLHEYETKLRSMAVTDELTGLANRRFVLDRAEQEFVRTKRLGPPEKRLNTVGCIMIDIDWFKKINDTHGHAAGDAVLRELAARLKPRIRKYDILGRFGGEEFVVLTPHTSLEQTETVAERIWEAIRQEPFTYDGHTLDVTASLGVSCTNEDDENMEQTIKRADENLYAAKRAGRDRVVA